jgi:two-component system chemotaxis response regulator CheB
MTKRDIVVIGGSAGSPEALNRIVGDLPGDLQAAIFIVTHLPVHGPMLLAGLLGAHTDLPVDYARDGDAIIPGRILMGPPGRHLLLTEAGVRLGWGPRENLSRPSIDALFRSAAVAYGGRVIGVVLTGMLNDGAAGLFAIREAGGVGVVQDPRSAYAPAMPQAAIAAAAPDHVAPVGEIGRLIGELTKEDAPLGRPPSAQMRLEVETAAGGRMGSERLMRIAEPTPLSCPECHGVLSEMKGDGPLRYRCQVGHAYSAEVVDAEQDEALETAMITALRIIEERITLVARLAQDAQAQGHNAAADLHGARLDDYRQQAEILRRAVQATVSGRQDDAA